MDVNKLKDFIKETPTMTEEEINGYISHIFTEKELDFVIKIWKLMLESTDEEDEKEDFIETVRKRKECAETFLTNISKLLDKLQDYSNSAKEQQK